MSRLAPRMDIHQVFAFVISFRLRLFNSLVMDLMMFVSDINFFGISVIDLKRGISLLCNLKHSDIMWVDL